MNYNKHEPIPTWVWWTFALIFLVVVLIAVMLNRGSSEESRCGYDSFGAPTCYDAR